MNKFKAYRLSFLGLLIAIVLLSVTLYFELDLFEKLTAFLEERDDSEIDEFIIPSFIALSFFAVNQVIIIRNRELFSQKAKLYKTMVHASNHVLRTCLNQMLLVKMTAEETPGFDPEMIKLFDQIVATANAQLEALSKLDTINEKAIWETIYEHEIDINIKR